MASISVLILSYQLLNACFGSSDYMSRLRRYTNVEEEKEGKRKSGKKVGINSFKGAFFKELGKVKLLEGYKKKLQSDLARAHILLKAEELMTLSMILFFVFLAAIVIAGGAGAWPLAFIAGVIGWFLPSAFIKVKIKKRIKLLNEQLGDAITMISNSLKAGYSFFQAVEMVAEEMTGPVSEEFSILKKEVSLGLPAEKALENLVLRVSSEDLELVVTALLIQRQVGGNLAEVLDNITSTIRDRVKIKGELKTVTAQGRMSGWVISLLPVVLYLLIYMINPAQMSLLFTRPLGLVMMAVAVVMELIGIILIRKVVRIEI